MSGHEYDYDLLPTFDPDDYDPQEDGYPFFYGEDTRFMFRFVTDILAKPHSVFELQNNTASIFDRNWNWISKFDI